MGTGYPGGNQKNAGCGVGMFLWCPSHACKISGEVNIAMFSAWSRVLIIEHGASLCRYKGFIAVKGKECKFVFHGVGMVFSGPSSL